jgi:hypothetical protein
MKKIVFAFCISLISAGYIGAQSFGVSAYALGFVVKNQDYVDNFTGPERIIGHMPAFTPGVRVEMNFLVPGYGFPASGFNGLGISYFAPHSDSVIFNARLNNGYTIDDIIGIEKTTTFQIGFRFGYEFPQTFNDFLMINYGWGMGYQHTKKEYVLPDETARFPFTADDFEAETFLPRNHGEFALELFVGAVYELEKFSLVGQYSFSTGIDSFEQHSYRHGLTAGIYYPLKTF